MESTGIKEVGGGSGRFRAQPRKNSRLDVESGLCVVISWRPVGNQFHVA